jgi:hypothetical protein
MARETAGQKRAVRHLGPTAGEGHDRRMADMPHRDQYPGTNGRTLDEETRMTGSLPTDVELSLSDVLETDEELLGAVTTLAGTLVLTDRRVVIVREGRTYRPRTGIRSWWISPTVDLRCAMPRGGMGRLMVGTGKQAANFFVKSSDWEDALRMVTITRGQAYRGAAIAAAEAH